MSGYASYANAEKALVKKGWTRTKSVPANYFKAGEPCMVFIRRDTVYDRSRKVYVERYFVA